MNSSLALLLLIAILSVTIQHIESRVFYAQPEFEYDSNQVIRNTMKRNRQCLLNAGLSQGCDLSDLLQAQTQARKFMSFAGPGK